MGQISIPASNKSGYSMFWNSMWDSKHNYNVFLKQDIFIKSSLILFFSDYSSDKLFFFLKFNSRNKFKKYRINNVKNKKKFNFNLYYKFIRNVGNNNDIFFSKLWLLRYQSWVILNISIFLFFKEELSKKKLEINFDNWFFHYYKNLLVLNNKKIKPNKYIF
jgi:hypothetical protein